MAILDKNKPNINRLDLIIITSTQIKARRRPKLIQKIERLLEGQVSKL